MPVTQKDIANRLGVDRSLVAHALRGDPRIAEITRQRVLEVATELGYTANSNMEARTLIARRHGNQVHTGQIAVLMGDPLKGSPLQSQPFFGEIIEGIQEGATGQSIEVSYHYCVEGQLPRAVLAGHVDGVISVYSTTISDDLDAKGVTLPAVRLDDYDPRHWTIGPANERGVHDATNHLLELGHRRIAYLGPEAEYAMLHPAQLLRIRGYRRAHEEAGLEAPNELFFQITKGLGESHGFESMTQLLAATREFTAVVCANDGVAIGAMAAAEQAGVSVPDELSITGFDGIELSRFQGLSTLTTASFDRRLMGRRAVQILGEIRGAAEPLNEVLPTRLLVRGSTAKALALIS